MASTVHNSITPLHVLLGTISSQILKKDVSKIKVHLQGHLNKESLDSLRSGEDIINILYQRGIVNDKKLAFLRGLLAECGLLELVDLLDEYRKTRAEAQSRQGIVIAFMVDINGKEGNISLIRENITSKTVSMKSSSTILRLADLHSVSCFLG